MKRPPLYSSARQREARTPAAAPVADAAALTPAGAPVAAAKRSARLARWAARHERKLWASAVLALFGTSMLYAAREPKVAPLTMEQVDWAMRKSIDEKPLPSASAKAVEAVGGSVVRVVGLMSEDDDGSDKPPDKDHAPMERGVGSGVVIVDTGIILTNLHVVSGARKIKVTFADGLEADAHIVNTQPENDLAVLRAHKIPDDLQAATMRGTADLRPGDEVVAVGFPFGIGPSVSQGVVSGLKREFRSPDGQNMLTNLIQFDAAANPGNSGGPLVTMDGAVVGIVTAILNPARQRVFIGIGFAVPIENAATAAGLPPF
jgi:S1-C subfamily serine protease